MNKLLLAIGLTCLVLISCNSGNKSAELSKRVLSEASAKSFIDSVNTAFSTHVKAGDSASLASLYWPDAELLLDNSEPIKGADMQNTWGAVIRMGVKDMNFITTDIRADSQFIVETGSYQMQGSKNSLIDKGKYVVIWENRNGQWKLYRDIGCTSMPVSK
jgi:ketosteroid isomerase-like protein